MLLALASLLIWACQPQPTNQNDNTGNTEQPGGNDQPGENDNPGVDPSTLPAEDWFNTPFYDRTDIQQAGLRGPVKSVVIQGYSDQGFKYPEHEEYEYNQDGRVTRMSVIKEGEPSSSYDWTLTYDADGHVQTLKKQYRSADYEDIVIEFVYENKGKRVAYFGVDWGGALTIDTQIAWYGMDLVNDLSYVKESYWLHDYYPRITERFYTFDADGNLSQRIVSTSLYYEEPDKKDVSEQTKETVYRDGYPYSSPYQVKSCIWYSNGMVAEKRCYGGVPEEEVYTYYENPRVIAKKSYRGGPVGMFGAIFSDYEYDDNWDLVRSEASFWTEEQVPPKEGVTYTYKEVDGVSYVINTDTWTDYKYDSHGNWISRIETIQPITQPGESFPYTYVRTIEYY